MDFHIHTKYSTDGEMAIEEVCIKAIEMGLKEIAITDHIDIDWPVPGVVFDIPDIDEYIKEIEDNKKRFKGQLSIKTGIEMGLQPHVLEDASKIINSYPFDFVIGSVHIIDRFDPYQGDYFKSKSKEESYELYYREILSLIKDFDDFDVLGHIGYIKRYSPFPYHREDELLHLDLIDKILNTLIKKGKGIEVNTSGFRHMSECPMPPLEIIIRYRQLGGSILTIGSDAHNAYGIGFGIEAGLELIEQSGFEYITSFTSRKPDYIRL